LAKAGELEINLLTELVNVSAPGQKGKHEKGPKKIPRCVFLISHDKYVENPFETNRNAIKTN